MIIVIKDADFSASNVGKIDIPKPVYILDTDTSSILKAYGAESLSKATRQEVNNFIVSLKDIGVYQGLQLLMLPFLADANASRRGINAITETNFLGAEYQYSSYGIKPTTGVVLTGSLDNSSVIRMLAVYVNEEFDAAKQSEYTTIYPSLSQFSNWNLTFKSTPQMSIGKRVANNSIAPSVYLANRNAVGDVNYSKNKSSLIGSFSLEDKKILGSVDGHVFGADTDDSVTTKELTGSEFYIGSYGKDIDGSSTLKTQSLTSQSILMAGDVALSSDQHVALNAAMVRLMDYINANGVV